ncbi:hypothetical protein VaNZ11_006333 [Volvox africanus]|uniref:UBX domain-containing protein n=1 Tax=Volvox africanus TaxID=51714 RepID=A0ABQ5S291_9CHLO|nr:hypothetical protein VaNZ11_006333 [Volvox africanus]
MALDGLGEKLKSLFKPKEDPRFKGQGRRLGTAEAQSNFSSNTNHPQHGANGVLAARRPAAFDTGEGPLETHTPLKPPPQPQGPGGRPALVLSRSHRTEDVVLDAAVMANTPTGKEANLVAAHKPPSGISSNLGPAVPSPSHPTSSPGAASPCSPTTAGGGGGGNTMDTQGLEHDLQRSSGGGRGRHSVNSGGGQSLAAPGRGRTQSRAATSNLSSMVSTISTPTAAEKRMGGFRCPAPPTDGAMADYGLAPATSQAYELQRCLALVLSSQPLSNSNLSTGSSASALAAVIAGTSMPPLAPLLQTPTLVASTAAAAAAPCRSASSTEAAEVSAAPSDETAQASLKPVVSSSLSAKSLTPSFTSSEAAAGDVAAAVVAAPAAAAGASEPSGAGGGAAAAATCTSSSGHQGTAGPRECCDALLRVLGNVMTKPEDNKFRQIRLSNPRVQETIVRVPGAVEFLEAAGFQMHFSPDDGSETANHGYLVLPDEIPPTALAEPFRILSAVMAAHGFVAAVPKPASVAAGSAGQPSQAPASQQKQSAVSAGAAGAPSLSATAAASSVATSSAIERCTQVLLPAAPDTKVPDWFFERTGAEIREQWAAIIRKREEQERFMTRTMREVRMQQEAAAAAAAGGAMTGGDIHAAVRVRFPEGVCLQGQFGASEPVSRVFEWVSGSLRSPALTFELIKPDRRPLETSATATADKGAGKGATPARASAPRPGRLLTVRDADMMPSILLNLRPTGPEAATLVANNVPLLSDELLRKTKPM